MASTVYYKFSLPYSIDIGKRKKIMIQLAPSLNVMLREPHFTRTKRKEEIKRWLHLQQMPTKPLKKATISFVRHSLKLLDPIDNMGASFKCIGDALVECGFLADDSCLEIVAVNPRQIKVDHRIDQWIYLEVFGT